MYIIYNLQKIYSSALTCAAIKVLNMPLRQVSHRARTHLCLVYVYLRVCAQAKDSRPKPFACSTIPGKKSFPGVRVTLDELGTCLGQPSGLRNGGAASPELEW